jgi:SanA protein
VKRKIKIALLAALTIVVLFSVTANFIVKTISKDKLYTEVTRIPKNKVGMVLGTSKLLRNGRINLYFQYRIDATIALFAAGKIEYVLVSGDNGAKEYDEPTDFKNELIKRGIPASKIFLDYAGFRTLDSVVRAKVVFGQSKFTVISQKFHNERAVYLGSQLDVEMIGFNASDVKNYGGFKTKVREYFARSKAVLDILFGTKPTFLGGKIKIG